MMAVRVPNEKLINFSPPKKSSLLEQRPSDLLAPVFKTMFSLNSPETNAFTYKSKSTIVSKKKG